MKCIKLGFYTFLRFFTRIVWNFHFRNSAYFKSIGNIATITFKIRTEKQVKYHLLFKLLLYLQYEGCFRIIGKRARH